MSFLSLENVSVRFGGVNALSEVSFSLEPGGVSAIIGPNGAGKTTLINAVSGLVPIDNGRIFFDGAEIQGKTAQAIARAGLGRAFQHAELMADETVVENIIAGRTLRTRPSLLQCMLWTPALRDSERQARNDALAMLEGLGLRSVANLKARELSYGVAKKIDIGRALMGAPRLLLLDEPTAGLSDIEADDLIGLCLRAVKDFGTTLLLIEHNLRVVMAVSQRVIVLDYGRKIADGIPSVVTADPAVVTAYLGEELPGA
jgi:ABC-type branched-subunit amino acid transport system ATPase component